MRHVPTAGGDGTTFECPGASGGAVAAPSEEDGVALGITDGVVCGEDVAVGIAVGEPEGALLGEEDPPDFAGVADG